MADDSPVDPTQSPLSPILRQWIAKHGPQTGEGYALDPIIDSTGPLGGKTKNPNPTYRYTFADGSTLEADWYGAIKNTDEVDPAKAPATETAKDPWGGTYERDRATGQWKPVVQGDWSQMQKGYTEAAQIQAKHDEIEANRAAGRGGLTDQQVQDLALQRSKFGLDEQTLKQRQHEFEQKNIIDKKTEDRLLEESKANIGLIKARTAGTGVETAISEEKLAQLIKGGPAAIRQAELNNEITQLQADQARQALNKPTVLGGTEGSTLTIQQPAGEITERMRMGYVPKTMAEVQARIGQIHAAAQAKQQEVTAKYRDDPERGVQEFNAWYAQNVESQMEGLEAARQEALQKQAQDQMAARQQAYTAALGAGTGAVNAFNAMAANRVGPGWQQAVSAANRGDWEGMSVPGATTWQGPDVEQLRQQSVMDALKWISPTAAQATGTPQPDYAGQNPAAVLARTNYQPFGGAPLPSPASAPAAAAAAGPTPEQMANRQAASAWTNQATLQGGGWGGMGPGAGIGNNAMANAVAAYQAQQEAAAQAAAAAAAQPPPVAAAPVVQPRPYRPTVAPPPAPPAPWGPQASAAMNIGGWNTPEPWGPQASAAMNIGGWNPPAYSASPYQEGQDYLAGTSPTGFQWPTYIPSNTVL